MDFRRVRTWEWLTGAAGIALLVSLFLPWYSAAGAHVTGWQAFTVIDLILALAGACAIALPVVTAMQRTAAVPQALASTIVWVLAAAAVLAVVRLLDIPDVGEAAARAAGVWIGAIAAAAALVFDIASIRDARFPEAMRPPLRVETIPAPAADGTRADVP